MRSSLLSRKLSSWYTTERWQKPTPEQSRAYEKTFGRKPFRLICKSNNGTLFSRGHYPTKATPEDLPASFVFARIGKLFGYYDASRVTSIAYKPNMWINHLFRDDLLFISFSAPCIDPNNWDGVDIVLSGWDIITALAALERFSSVPETDLAELRDAIANKVKTYRETHPDEHDCIKETEFWEMLEKERGNFTALLNGQLDDQ